MLAGSVLTGGEGGRVATGGGAGGAPPAAATEHEERAEAEARLVEDVDRARDPYNEWTKRWSERVWAFMVPTTSNDVVSLDQMLRIAEPRYHVQAVHGVFVTAGADTTWVWPEEAGKQLWALLHFGVGVAAGEAATLMDWGAAPTLTRVVPTRRRQAAPVAARCRTGT